MPDTNPFFSRYKTLRNAELLTVINNPDNYHPLALEAAHTELNNRQLTPEQLELLYNNVETPEQQKVIHEQKAARISHIVNFLNPLSEAVPPVSKYINIITIIAAALYIVALIFGGKLMLIALFNPAFYSPFFFYSSIPYLLFPIGILLFGLRKKVGWLILCLVSAYKAIELLIIYKKEIGFKLDSQFGSEITDTRLIIFGIVILFTLFVAISVCRADIRGIYKVSNRAKVLTIALAAGWALFDMLKPFGV